ncbi:MAG: energy transducer TonB [Stenotrophomonas sp.]|nr:energy transducer TonB [Xanthomonadales bacterium]MBN8767967.1 energy transducer TonB [Stenotrophomonas sp.]
MSASNKRHQRLVPVALTMAVVVALAGCKKDEAATAGPQAAPTAAKAPTPESVVATSVSAMGVDELREAASKAYNENRLYAPAGNNAMEYYLALRDKQPGNASAASALSDLLPMAVIAADQALARDDLDEAKRLVALIGKADPNHPALGRLKAGIAGAEATAKKRAEAQALSAEEEAKRRAELAKQREEDQKKLQEQQRQQQAAAEQQRQQQAAAEAEAERVRQQQAAAAEAERQRQQQAAAQQAAPAAAAPRPAAAGNELRPVSLPGPKFPPAAQRAGASGSVQVEYTVGTDGRVTSARVVSADVPRQFQRDFEREALAAVKRWRFQPVSQAVTSRRTIAFEQ